nr:MAG TPA: hypothetical protein [Caudoviricetes sp.]
MTTHVFGWSFSLYACSLKVLTIKSACINYKIELT